MFVKMLKTISIDGTTYSKDEVYELDADTAKNWVELGAAVEEKKDLVAEFKSVIQESQNQLVKSLTESFKAVQVSVPATPRDDTDKSAGDFLIQVAKAHSNNSLVKESAQNTLKNKYYAKAAQDFLNTSINDDEGGYLVPPEYQTEIFKVEGYDPVMFPTGASIARTRGIQVFHPTLVQTGTPSGGSSAFTGNVVTAKTTEGSAAASFSKHTFGQVQFDLVKRMLKAEATNDLLSEAPQDVESLILGLFREQAVLETNYEAFRGAGTNGITGIIDDTATIAVNRDTASTVKLVDFAKMYARLLPGARQRAVWVINPLIWEKLITMESTAGQLVWSQSVTGRPSALLFGLPVYDSEALPVLGNAGDVLLVDRSKYQFYVNTNVRIDFSDHVAYYEDRRGYRLKYKLAAKPLMAGPIILQNGTDTVSYAVQLDDPAS